MPSSRRRDPLEVGKAYFKELQAEQAKKALARRGAPAHNAMKSRRRDPLEVGKAYFRELQAEQAKKALARRSPARNAMRGLAPHQSSASTNHGKRNAKAVGMAYYRELQMQKISMVASDESVDSYETTEVVTTDDISIEELINQKTLKMNQEIGYEEQNKNSPSINWFAFLKVILAAFSFFFAGVAIGQQVTSAQHVGTTKFDFTTLYTHEAYVLTESAQEEVALIVERIRKITADGVNSSITVPAAVDEVGDASLDGRQPLSVSVRREDGQQTFLLRHGEDTTIFLAAQSEPDTISSMLRSVLFFIASWVWTVGIGNPVTAVVVIAIIALQVWFWLRKRKKLAKKLRRDADMLRERVVNRLRGDPSTSFTANHLCEEIVRGELAGSAADLEWYMKKVCPAVFKDIQSSICVRRTEEWQWVGRRDSSAKTKSQ